MISKLRQQTGPVSCRWERSCPLLTASFPWGCWSKWGHTCDLKQLVTSSESAGKKRPSSCDSQVKEFETCQQSRIFPFQPRISDLSQKNSLQLLSPAQLLNIFTDYIRRRKWIWDFIASISTPSRKCKLSVLTGACPWRSQLVGVKRKKEWKPAAATFNPCSSEKEAENSETNTVRSF